MAQSDQDKMNSFTGIYSFLAIRVAKGREKI
jgi:hypothetical protein